MNQRKILTLAIMCAAFFIGNVYAFDKSFDPNHRFVDRESIGPKVNPDYILDKDKAAKTKTAEEEMQIPSEAVVPSDPSPKNSNIPTGAARRLTPAI